MPIVPVYLDIDEKSYAAVLAGTMELGGLLKDTKLKQVKKHLPTVNVEAKNGIANAVAVLKEHKNLVIGVGVGALGVGMLAGFLAWILNAKKRKVTKKFAVSLQAYLIAAQSGQLTYEAVETLIADLDAVAKVYRGEDIPLKLSSKQLSVLFQSIYDYTKRMAEATGKPTEKISAPKRFTKNNVVDLRKYFEVQRELLRKEA